jgi:flagellar biosynthetic protein FlhB
MADSHNKTEQPTQRKLDKARKEGQLPVSREFVGSVQFAGFLALLFGLAPHWYEASRQWTRHLLKIGFEHEISPTVVFLLLKTLVLHLALPVLAVGGLIALLTLATQLAMTRMGLSTSRLAPDLKRLNPANKLKQLPQQNIPQFFQALFLLPLFCFAVFAVASENLDTYMRLPLAGLETGVRAIGESLKELLWRAAGLFVVIGSVDLLRQRRRWKTDLRMSKQDIRDEMKEVEGDPHIKMRIRRLRRELLRRNMMKEVDTATAVIVNPTHFAVALRYTPESMPAPKVVAKGKNYLAQRIRERAIRHQVPIVENPPLAQALYKSAQVGQDIPMHLYRAVAEVLAYIYRLMNGHRGTGRR